MSADEAGPKEVVGHLPDVRAPAGFGNREKLFADLGEAVTEASASKLIVIFELAGLEQHARAFGSTATSTLLARLAERLADAVGASGCYYGLRGSEFCGLIDDPGSERSAVLDALAAALGEAGDGYEITAAFGAVLLPDEAADTASTLELADRRLNSQKRARGIGPEHRFETALA